MCFSSAVDWHSVFRTEVRSTKGIGIDFVMSKRKWKLCTMNTTNIPCFVVSPFCFFSSSRLYCSFKLPTVSRHKFIFIYSQLPVVHLKFFKRITAPRLLACASVHIKIATRNNSNAFFCKSFFFFFCIIVSFWSSISQSHCFRWRFCFYNRTQREDK